MCGRLERQRRGRRWGRSSERLAVGTRTRRGHGRSAGPSGDASRRNGDGNCLRCRGAQALSWAAQLYTGHKLDGGEVADAIRQASIRNVVTFNPDDPATDWARSLDFDRVRVEGEAFPATSVQVEVSYRAAVVDDPVEGFIGDPFYDPFPVLTMTARSWLRRSCGRWLRGCGPPTWPTWRSC